MGTQRRVSVRATYPTPELGIEAGDVIGWDPDLPHHGVLVIRQLPVSVLPLLTSRVPAFRETPHLKLVTED